MNTSHVATNGTTSKRGQSEQGQPWWRVVRVALKCPARAAMEFSSMKTVAKNPARVLVPLVEPHQAKLGVLAKAR
jgi:hypothetical protein